MESINIVDFLDSLGSSSAAVAAKLCGLGIKGIKGSSCNCPLAVAMRRFTNIPYEIKVTASGYITIMEVSIADPYTPEAVRRFVHRFDMGEYPELEIS